MKITIYRSYRVDRTVGELWIDGDFICDTVEDAGRPAGIKIPGFTCIPEGEYKITTNYSPRFKAVMPLVYSNPNTLRCEYEGIVFDGIRIHGGTNPDHTEGCICVDPRKKDYVNKTIIAAVDRREPVTLRITRKTTTES